MKRLLAIFALCLIPSFGWSTISTRLNITEEDGSPSTFPYKLKFANGTVADNGDGTTSVSNSGGGGSTNGTISVSTPTNVAVYSGTTTVTGYTNLINDGTNVSAVGALISGDADGMPLTVYNTNVGLGDWYAGISFVNGALGNAGESFGWKGGTSPTGFFFNQEGTGTFLRINNVMSSSQFVKTDANQSLVSYDLYGGTNVYTGGNTFRSTTTFNGAVNISTTVHLSGSTGTNGQVLTSGGPGAVASWTTIASGGASTLAIATGTSSGFTVPGTSPTAVINLNSSLFTSTLTGSATAYVTLVLSSVTALGSDIDVSGAEISGVLKAAAFPALTGDITTSAGALATTAAALQNNITTLGASSTTISGATGLKVNSLTTSQMVRTDASKLLISSPTVNASTEFVGTLQAAQEPAHSGDVTNSAGSLAMTAASNQANILTMSASSVTFTGANGVLITGGVLQSTGVYVASATVYCNAYLNGNSSTAQTIDWTKSNVQMSTTTGNVTYTFVAPTTPRSAILHLCVWTGAGSFTATWPATVKWPGGVAPVLTTTASKVDCFDFRYVNEASGGTYFGDFDQNY